MTDRNVFLRTDEIDLVLVETTDAPVALSWLNDQNVTQFLARGAHPMSLAQEEHYLTDRYKDPNDLSLGIWCRADKTLIGMTGLHQIDQLNQTANFGIVIGNSKYWGKGIGTIVLTAVLTYAFETRNLRNVRLSVYGNNKRGLRCYEKCGFAKVGILPGHKFKRGQWIDEVLMICHNPALS